MRITLDTTYIPVYNTYSGQTETMQAKWANLKKIDGARRKEI